MSKVAIHQPQYLPWFPYFQKIAAVDCFVFLDNVQYQKRALQNRNQIKGPNGPVWLTVPVNASRNDDISDVRIADNTWQDKHYKSIKQFYSKAMHWQLSEELISPVLTQNHESLAELNIAIIKRFLGFFGIKTRLIKASDMAATGKKEDLIINICRELEATDYLSGTGASAYQEEANFHRAGIKLSYFQTSTLEYVQCHQKSGFTPGMSALDMVLNIGEESCSLINNGN